MRNCVVCWNFDVGLSHDASSTYSVLRLAPRNLNVALKIGALVTRAQKNRLCRSKTERRERHREWFLHVCATSWCWRLMLWSVARTVPASYQHSPIRIHIYFANHARLPRDHGMFVEFVVLVSFTTSYTLFLSTKINAMLHPVHSCLFFFFAQAVIVCSCGTISSLSLCSSLCMWKCAANSIDASTSFRSCLTLAAAICPPSASAPSLTNSNKQTCRGGQGEDACTIFGTNDLLLILSQVRAHVVLSPEKNGKLTHRKINNKTN